MSDDGSNNLQGSFGDKGTNVNQLSYGHPNGEKIVGEAKNALRESDIGAHLIKVCETHRIPVHVIKGTGNSGFDPMARIVYLQMPGKAKKAESATIINLIKGLREADQELIGFTLPDPKEDLMEYAAVMHAKNLDSITYICKVVKELSNSLLFPDLIDALTQLGYIKVYKAYEKGASEQELYRTYAGIETV